MGRPVGIALDWLHNRLYWTDSDWNTIESSGLDGSWRTVVVYRRLDKPRDVVVDPERGCVWGWGVCVCVCVYGCGCICGG